MYVRMPKTTLQEVEVFIQSLLDEARACEEIGSNFSASEYREEANRLQSLLDRWIIPQATPL